ncbi:MAG: cytochrome c3 family protein [Nitrospiraceae bacterium]|nr:cytochrome c3 family protein [Nitrospiraceae bacterium]
MRNHVFRPLIVVVGLVAIVLVVRVFYVPGDFRIHENGYMYGWYRTGNIEDWKKVKVKYQGREYCKDCHPDKLESISQSPHAIIQCENCHGPGIGHPDNPAKLPIDRSRGLCLRCHTKLPYPTSGRANIRGIDPDTHNAGIECASCHNPHKPSLEGLK